MLKPLLLNHRLALSPKDHVSLSLSLSYKQKPLCELSSPAFLAADPRVGQHQREKEGASVLLPLQFEGSGLVAIPSSAHGRVRGTGGR